MTDPKHDNTSSQALILGEQILRIMGFPLLERVLTEFFLCEHKAGYELAVRLCNKGTEFYHTIATDFASCRLYPLKIFVNPNATRGQSLSTLMAA
jgi:hypothetical protein